MILLKSFSQQKRFWAYSIFFLLLNCYCYATTAYGAIYYMPDDFPNLRAAFLGMKGGDTLIIRDGTYKGDENIISTFHHPPFGSVSAYTKIVAEHDGKVIFDGEGVRRPIWFEPGKVTDAFWEIRGIKFKNSSASVVYVVRTTHIKFFKCGFVDSAGATDAFYAHTCSYILLEDCYSYGNARYHFHYYNTDYSILRRCVARHDRGVAIYQVGFQVYNSANILVQNCIFVDGNQYAYYNNVGQYYAFKVPQVNRNNISFEGCIALNSPSAGFLFIQAGNNNFVKNCIAWDLKEGDYFRGAEVDISHCTYGNFSQVGTKGDGTIKHFHDSLIYNSKYGIDRAGGTITNDYNSLFLVNTEYHNIIPGSHSFCLANFNAIDPRDGNPGNGIPALKYLPRIERGSDLDGKASDGGDIGATILYKIGRDGTLWGDSGYNEITSEPLWPFPNEELIRQQMSQYSYDANGDGIPEITGERGFCADGNGLYGGPITLTSYIWEYLGNRCPSEICNYGSNYHTMTLFNNNVPPNNVPSGNKPPSADAGSDQTVTDKDGNGSEDVVLDGSKSSDSDGSVTDYIWLENGTQIATGVNPTVTLNVGSHDITLQVIDNDNATATDTVQIIVNSLKQSAVGMQTLQDFEDGVLWIPGGNQDPTGNGRGWAFLDAGPNARIEIDNIGANGSHKSLKITFDSNNPLIYFRSDDKIRDHMPEAKGANRMSFYVRFPEGFPVQTLPFRYDTWQFGTFIHDPNDWSDLHAATFESDHGIHHYYHRLTVEQVGNGWVKYIITTQPDQANYSGSTVPPNIPYYFDQLGRFYFHFGPEAGGPDPGRPFTIWIDEIKFYYDDGSVGGQIHIGGQNDPGFDGEFIPDAVTNVNRAPSLTEFTASPNPADNPKRNIKFAVQASDPDGDKLTYSIDFGDGSKASASVATHAYVKKGNYKVEAVVSDGNGHTVAKTIQITVDDASPNKIKIIQIQK